jgi:diguanylate cyclase (GGDEF)-like protein
MLVGRDLEDRQALLARVMEMHHLSLRRGAELRRLANTDPLTGVSNRREVWKNAKWIWANSPIASVVLLDLDKFKKINDVYGHDTGDAVLKGVAEALNRAVGHGAVVGRWGGEEFVAIFEGDASGRSEEILRAIRVARIDGAPPGLKVTASLGMAIAPDTTITIADAVAAADAAMYNAKEAGGDRIVVRHLQSRESTIPPANSDRRASRQWR